jgi:hypothetical protein
MKRAISTLVLLAVLLVAAITLTGCSGGSGVSGTQAAGANVTFHVTWPASATSSVVSAKLLPAAARSYVISIYDTSLTTPVAVQVINFPATAATFTGLPVGTLTVVVKAYATTVTLPVSGSLVPLASVTQILQTQPGNANNPPAINLVSTIDHIVVTPPASVPVSGGAITLSSGGAATAPLVATPVDANGNPVTVSAGQIQWTSSNKAAASVDAKTGVVTPATLPAGTKFLAATITATDPESKKTGTIGVVVTSLTQTTASATITVKNPPPGTKSLVVTLTASGASASQQVGPVVWTTPTSPSTTTQQLAVPFTQITTASDPQTFNVAITAYATASGTGLVTGTGSGAVIVSGGTGAATVDLGGSADTLKIKPTTSVDLTKLIQAGPGNNPPGSVVALEVDLYNGSGGLIGAIDPTSATVKWSPATGSVLTVTDGVLTAGTSIGGPVTVTVQDLLTGKSAQLTGVTVLSNQGSASGTVN